MRESELEGQASEEEQTDEDEDEEQEEQDEEEEDEHKQITLESEDKEEEQGLNSRLEAEFGFENLKIVSSFRLRKALRESGQLWACGSLSTDTVRTNEWCAEIFGFLTKQTSLKHCSIAGFRTDLDDVAFDAFVLLMKSGIMSLVGFCILMGFINCCLCRMQVASNSLLISSTKLLMQSSIP